MSIKNRGFASMTPERRREIASLGGRAAHQKGTAHQFKAGEEAQSAGRKGGTSSRLSKQGRQQAQDEEETQRQTEVLS